MSNFCFFTLGFLGTAMHSHACTTHLWHGLPSSQANLALIQFAQAFLIPLGMWLINNRLQVLVVMICGDREFTPDNQTKKIGFAGLCAKPTKKKLLFARGAHFLAPASLQSHLSLHFQPFPASHLCVVNSISLLLSNCHIFGAFHRWDE